MYRLQNIFILSLLPIATLAFVGLMTMTWFQAALDVIGRVYSAYIWIVFVALAIKGLKRKEQGDETLHEDWNGASRFL